MKKLFSNPYLIAGSISVVLIVVILLLPRTPSSEEMTEKEMPSALETVSDFQEVIEQAKMELTEDQRKRFDELESGLEGSASKQERLAFLDSMVFFWQYLKNNSVAAEFQWKLASEKNAVEDWFMAGDAFFMEFQNAKEEMKKSYLERSIGAYENVLKMDEKNSAGLNALGVCYVEGASYLGVPPMKGIGMIKSVLDSDPNNIDALVNLGYFGIKSGQYEKAIERFERVLEIDSTHIEAYLYLTDIYVSLEEMDKAISSLNTYKKYVKDEEKVRQIEAYIKDLKNNI